jgi:hypothetical protein
VNKRDGSGDERRGEENRGEQRRKKWKMRVKKRLEEMRTEVN